MPSTTTTTISPAQLAALLNSLNADLAKASAVDAFVQAKAAAAAAVAAAQAGQPGPPAAAADPALMKVAAGELAAGNAKDAAQRRLDSTRHRLGQMGIALYVHDDTAGDTSVTSPSDGTALDRSVLLSLLLSQAKAELTTAKRTLDTASQTFAVAKVQADQVVSARAAAIEAKQVAAATLTTATTSPHSTSTTAAGPAGKTSTTSTTKPARPAQPQAQLVAGPTILGSAALTGPELSAWYASAGHQARLTVPLDTLTGYYQGTGTAMGIRDDIAFAQAMIETGYFSFPSFGQVAVTDNNYAGIGACDTCARGFTFPDAKTGVTAQLQLLHADASTQPVPPGPLPAPVGVSGCCPTWLALGGVWATAPDYGYNILKLYKQMLEWTLQRRQSNAGL
ncbi:MAG TPA: glucosaminidase domain-containing protein [Acidimicrobiales bacterium]|nr:glucosaminidase domain-containing protein [Acidimicrobiales bacterium]